MIEVSGKKRIGVQSNPKYCEDKWAFKTVDSYVATSATSQMCLPLFQITTVKSPVRRDNTYTQLNNNNSRTSHET